MDGKSSVKCSWNYHNQLFIPSEIEKDLITSDNALLLTCHNAAKYTLNPLTQIPHAYRKHFWNQPNCHIVINSDKLVSREVTFHSTKKRNFVLVASPSFIWTFLFSALGKPAHTYTRVELKKGGRKTLTSIRNTIRKGRYRKDLKMVSYRRIIYILFSMNFNLI